MDARGVPTSARVRALEPWMLSNLITGAVMSAFLVLLIPPFITQVTGSAARVGVVFAVIALAAMLGPWFGSLADRFAAHRVIYSLSFVGMATAFAVLALDATSGVYSPIAGILLGASISAKGTVGSGFLVGSGLPEPVQARQLTAFNLLIFAGQVVGGALVATLHSVGVGYVGQFWTVTVLIAAGAVFTWFTTALPETRLRIAAHPIDTARLPRATVSMSTPSDADLVDVGVEEGAGAAPIDPEPRPGFIRMLRSPFGALLAIMVLGAIGATAFSSQVANILPAVFEIDPTVTSWLVALSGAIGVPVVLVAGAWLGRAGPAPVLTASILARAAGFLVLALLGLATAQPWISVLAAGLYLAVMAANGLQLTPRPRAAALLSPQGPSEANGFVGAASAVGAFLGSIGAGIVADGLSYEAVLWLCAVPAIGAAILALPVHRRLVAVRAAARDRDVQA